MSTNSTISLMHDDGSIDSVYCHQDGYLSGVGRYLLAYYQTPEDLQELISFGGIVNLAENVRRCKFFHRDQLYDLHIPHFTDFREYMNNLTQREYNYLYVPQTGWCYFSYDTRATQPADLQKLQDAMPVKVLEEIARQAEKDSFKSRALDIVRRDANAAESAYRRALECRNPADLDVLENIIMDVGTGWDAYLFARDIPCADVIGLQSVVIQRGTGSDILEFAKGIQGANIGMLQDAIIEKGSLDIIYAFSKQVKGAASPDVMLEKMLWHRKAGRWPAVWSRQQDSAFI